MHQSDIDISLLYHAWSDPPQPLPPAKSAPKGGAFLQLAKIYEKSPLPCQAAFLPDREGAGGWVLKEVILFPIFEGSGFHFAEFVPSVFFCRDWSRPCFFLYMWIVISTGVQVVLFRRNGVKKSP